VNGLVALDWGTTSLRGALLDAGGRLLEERSSTQGILSIEPGGFAAVFESLCGDWMAAGDPPCLIAGMAGSRQGWIEAAYCSCPAGLVELVRSLAWLPALPGRGGQRMAIVPGMSCDADGAPDVMRGEETQVFGAAQLLGLRDATLVLPGTHSKWVNLRGGRIESFASFMTGEFYALLRQHSILARTMPADDGALDEQAFDRGVALALQGPSLLHRAFSARTLALFERMAPAALPSYLSGLVIGEELRAQAAVQADRPVLLIGSELLTQRYQRALAQRGIEARSLGAQATWQGLWSIAQQAGLLPAPAR
jgi:2-dehydro-3-deoxygalactonokinase